MCETKTKLNCKLKTKVQSRIEQQILLLERDPQVILIGEEEFHCLRKETAMELHADYLKIHPKTYRGIEIVQVKKQNELRVL